MKNENSLAQSFAKGYKYTGGISTLTLLLIQMILINIHVEAQLSPISNEYVVNPYLINPALAGIDQSTNLKLTSRMQWVGLDDAPQTQSLSFDMRIKALAKYDHNGKVLRKVGIPRTGRVGIGVYVLNDMNNPFRRSGVQFSYAYHIPFKHGEAGQLSVGMSGAFYQHYVSNSDFIPADDMDPALSGKEIVMIPNMSFGVNYLYRKFVVSISSLNLYPAKINHYNENIETVGNQVYLYSGYQIGNSASVSFTPAVLFRNNPQSIDVSGKISIKDKISLVLAWQSIESAYAFFHFRIGNYLLGYSFEYSMSEVQRYNDGTHLVFLGYQFN
ncbi:MAG: type IX secretion system membrane protein PorP/SprF [Bacteroidales bacterium]|nr:type IX secretion system membrane protein PorP/SprF [Bacteroidales bacterium]MCF8458786.1 type IX secretion system membrane protein PorP/SprF [Bacteroidales bacterium]